MAVKPRELLADTALLRSRDTKAIYFITAGQITPYYDFYKITPLDYPSVRVETSESLEAVAESAAREAVAAEEIKRFGNELINVIVEKYNPSQPPDLKLEKGRSGRILGYFTAHFVDFKGQTIKETRKHSESLRNQVFGNLNRFEGFDFIIGSKRSVFHL